MNIFIKFIILLFFLSACDSNLVNHNISTKNNILYQAAEKIGLDERINRQEIKEFTGVDPVHTEWCAAFVNSVLRESDIPGSDSVSDVPLMARSFLFWGEPITKENIYPGDIVVFPRGNQGWQGHVGFYIGTETVDGIEFYRILGGNQNNKVSIELFRVDTVLGIRRYSNELINTNVVNRAIN